MRLQICSGLLLLALAFSTANSEYLPKKIVSAHQVDKRDVDEETPLPRHVTPNNYNLELQPFFDEGIFRGRVEINISCHEPTDTIVLHAYRDLEVVAADKAIHSVGTFAERSVFKKLGQSHHYSRTTQYSPHSIEISQQLKNSDQDQFVIKLKSKMTKGTFYHFQLDFLGNISTSKRVGFTHRNYTDSESKEERWFASVNLNEKNARKVFPCFDEPQYKASVRLSVIVNKSYLVVSSMPLESTLAFGDNDKIKLEQFERSPPMSIQSLGLFISELRHLKPIATGAFGNTSIYGYGHSKLTTAFQSKIKKLGAHLEFIQSYIGFGFPLPQLHWVVLPSGHSEWAEGDFWGLLIFGENELYEQSYFSRVFYLLPKQWIGHMVTPDSQSDDVNDGLQLYLDFYGVFKQMEEDKDMENTVAWTFLFASKLYENNERRGWFFEQLRNCWVWRMLNYSLTAQTMSVGFGNFLHKRKFQIYNEVDLYMALDNQAWLDGVLPENISIIDIVKSWNGTVVFPILTVTRNYGDNSATIEQRPYIPDNYPNVTDDMQQHLFWIPITYVSEDSRQLNYVTWMKDKNINIKNLPADDSYIIVDPEHTGMFPVNYDKTNWDLLSQHLKISASEESPAMFPVNIRLKLLFDATFLAVKGELDFATAMDMTLFMRHERSFHIWSMMNEIIMNKITSLIYDTRVFDKFLIYCSYLYAPIYEYTKNLKLKGHLFEEFPPRVAIIAAEVGYEPAVVKATIRLQESLQDLTPVRTDCSVFRWSDKYWDLFLQRVLNTVPTNETSHKNLFYDLVWCNRKPKNLIRILHLVFTDDKYTFSDKDVKDILHAINDYHVLLNFIRQHWDEIKLRYGNNLEIWNLLFEEATKDVKTVEELQLVLKLYEEHKNDLQTAKDIVEDSIKLTQENMNGKYLYLNDINKWLDLHLPEITGD